MVSHSSDWRNNAANGSIRPVGAGARLPAGVENFQAPRKKKRALLGAVSALTLWSANAVHNPKPTEAQLNPQYTTLVAPTARPNLENLSGPTATVEQQTDGSFASDLAHIPPYATPPDGTENVVKAIRKVQPNAKITTWHFGNNANPEALKNTNFTFAFVSKGKGRYLVAEQNVFGHDHIAHMAQIVKVGKAPVRDKPFDNGEIFALSPIDPKTNKPTPKTDYLGYIAKGINIEYIAGASKFSGSTVVKDVAIFFLWKNI